ncbi:MAG: Crp/Fnr family transcriptional regulator [Bacteroidales bacterium]|nr:Crp/Fnr family transcriptional regulator [Bacteroidales bacterium]
MKTYSALDDCVLGGLGAPCFANLSPEEIALVSESKTQVLFRKGESLTKQGAFASSVLFVVEGLVRQYIIGDTNRDFNLRIIRSGEFVGLSAAFSKHTYDYSAIAMKETLACLIEKDAIAGLLKSNGNFAYGLINRYYENDSSLYNTIRSMMYKQMHGRLADVLLYLDTIKYNDESIFGYLSRKEIADFAGLSTESTVKLIKGFEQDGLIKLIDKDIEVLEREDLKEISKRG